jgi:hypothetical protein
MKWVIPLKLFFLKKSICEKYREKPRERREKLGHPPQNVTRKPF